MKKLSLTAALLSAALSATHADDVEIYTGAGGSGSSNILFVLDTSGSMSAWGNTGEDAPAPPPYDPTVDYPTDNYGFDPDAYYVFDSGEFQGGGDYLRGLSTYQVNRIKEYAISPDVLNCSRTEVRERLESDGVITDQFTFFKSGQGWSAPSRGDSLMNNGWPSVNTATNSILQCQENDSYQYNGSSYRYVANQGYFDKFGQPYTNDRSYQERWFWFTYNVDARYDWSTRGDGFYNIVWKGNYLNYMGTPYEGEDSGPQMRIDMVREAAKKVIDTTTAPNVQFSLVRFDSESNGGFVSIPMTPVSELRETFGDTIDKYDAAGGTPITESLYEAFRYLQGDTVGYGEYSKSRTYIGNISRDANTGMIVNTSTSVKSTPSVDGSRSGSTYTAPDFSGCTPKTKVILFSDGEPTGDEDINGVVRGLIGRIGFDPASYLSRNCGGDGGCAEELAYVMANSDHRPDIDGLQNITVDTMGGFLSAGSNAEQKLRDIAAAGKGTYYPVDTEESIELGLRNSMSGVIDSPSSFTSATVAINSFNSLENSDEVYFAVFAPANSQKWQGNLKRYRLGSDGQIYDAGGFVAVDEDTGFFAESAKSYWSANVDGNKVDRGGAASRLGETTRSIFSTNGDSIVKLTEASALLSDELLGLTDITDPQKLIETRTKLIPWILGFNDDGTVRKEMEDPLHSQPIVVNYGEGDSVVFVGTNSGYLHAFRANSEYPKELFAILPRELLQNAQEYMNEGSFNAFDKVYGLDGLITYYHKDDNLNGKVDNNDKVLLYVGMRRGGHSYYAFDVTDPSSPQLAWQINGTYLQQDGKNVPGVTSGFSDLGQTWSAMTPSLLKWEGKRRTVLFFGGGYDPTEDGTDLDGPEKRMVNSIGTNIYMVDAVTGELLWDAKTSTKGITADDMSNAFPSSVVPVDKNRDGFVDMLFASDVGGRIWRFDFNEFSESRADFAQGGILFDINQPNSDTGNRRFFNSPDLSLYGAGGKEEILINIGSGYRAHPLSTTTVDYHFILRDQNGTSVPSEYVTKTFDDLKEWGTDIDTAPNGWFVPLQQDYEKVLTNARIADGIIYFSTYAPQNLDDPDLCNGDTGVARLYVIDSLDPTGEKRLPDLLSGSGDGDGDGDGSGGGGGGGGDPRNGGGYIFINHGGKGIVPPPVITMPAAKDDEGEEDDPDPEITTICGVSTAVALVGPVSFATTLDQCDRVSKTYWKEE